jgi:ABC-type transporter Mla maintaining outer membrane lipid asymmetry ATPase subunit MlaF
VSILAPDAAPAPAWVLEARGLGKACGDREVLAGFDFAMARGEFVVLFGANGAGKSLLLRLWLGLERPDAGSVRLLGGEPAGGSRQQCRALLARTGVVFEHDALFEDRSVGDNVALALSAAPRRSAAAARRAVHESLLLVGLKHVDHLRPHARPAGTRRRVALARAIAHRPELLLVDEPAAGLDPIAGAALHELVAQLRTRLDLSVLVATRNPDPALPHADRSLRI